MAVISSCARCSIADEVERARESPERSITIINRTGNPVKNYRVTTASGVVVQEATDSRMDQAIEGNSVVKVDKAFNNDPVLQVQLIDVHGKIFVKDFPVPLEGNTDVEITPDHRKTEGWLKDTGKDIIEWFNKHKGGNK
jgi:hypothetical protein